MSVLCLCRQFYIYLTQKFRDSSSIAQQILKSDPRRDYPYNAKKLETMECYGRKLQSFSFLALFLIADSVTVTKYGRTVNIAVRVRGC